MATFSVREIPLTRGFVALVDESDYERIAHHKWFSVVSGKRTQYAMRQVRGPNGKRMAVLMHRAILEAPHGMEVDHIDGNGLNNIRSNLRLASRTQNSWNTPAKKGRRFKGVQKLGSRFSATITCLGRSHYLGLFESDEEAAAAYDEAAKKFHGEFASLNFGEDERERINQAVAERKRQRAIALEASGGFSVKIGLSHSERRERRRLMAEAIAAGNLRGEVARAFCVTTATVENAIKEFSQLT